MEIIEYKEKIDNLTYAKEKYLTPDTLLFDIECTGLSPRKSFVYLIGFAYRKNETLYITQLLYNAKPIFNRLYLTNLLIINNRKQGFYALLYYTNNILNIY